MDLTGNKQKSKKRYKMSKHTDVARLAGCILVLAVGITIAPATLSAAPLQPTAIQHDATASPDLIEVRAASRRGGAAVGPVAVRSFIAAELPSVRAARPIAAPQPSEDRAAMLRFATPQRSPDVAVGHGRAGTAGRVAAQLPRVPRSAS